MPIDAQSKRCKSLAQGALKGSLAVDVQVVEPYLRRLAIGADSKSHAAQATGHFADWLENEEIARAMRELKWQWFGAQPQFERVVDFGDL